MATKEQVTEYINAQWEPGDDSSIDHYWLDNVPDVMLGSRLSLIQNWVSPEVATILTKLVGNLIMIERLSKNRSNNA
jgi:hypothetical protein|tara:strand:- start:218 stop:448 length:231 start_codon:yes stop_codon:yes gene_type:complete